MDSPLLTEREAARLLGVAAVTLGAWRRVGTGPPFVRMGKMVRYRPTDVEAYIESKLQGKPGGE